MKDSIILLGGGGHCKSCIDVIEQEGRFVIAGILDRIDLVGSRILNYSIIGSDEEITILAEKHHFLIAVGQIKSPNIRVGLFGKLKQASANMATVVSPRAYLSPHAVIGEGSIVMHGAVVNAGAIIGSNCIINSHALVEHDAVIGDHCHIATGAIINGGVELGEQTFIGSRVMTREYITIGARSVVAGGMNVYRNLPQESWVRPP